MLSRSDSVARPKTIVSAEKIATNIFKKLEMPAEAQVVTAHSRATAATMYRKLSPLWAAVAAASIA